MIPIIMNLITIFDHDIQASDNDVERRHFKYSPAFPELPSRIFEVTHLKYNRKVLHQEDPAENGYHYLLADYIAKTAIIPPSARLPVSPINTWQVGIVPEKTYTSPDKCCNVNGQLTCFGDIHKFR